MRGLLLAAFVLVQLSGAWGLGCSRKFPGKHTTVLMVADPGTFSGSAEAKYLFSNLQDSKTITAGTTACPLWVKGKLAGQKVAVIESGIGPTAAALCAYDVLQCGGTWIKEIIYMGTSGWSPAQGGIVTPHIPTPSGEDGCMVPNTTPDITRVGDICITPYSINWNCKLTDYQDQCGGFPNLCNMPKENLGPTASFLYGQCLFTMVTDASVTLSDELIAAGRSLEASTATPNRPAAILKYEQDYWNIISSTTGVAYNISIDYKPRVWDYTQCAEVDSQFFYSGLPWEISCRNYSAIVMNAAMNTSLTARDVVCASAMESVGLGEAVQKYNSLKTTKKKISYTVMRANSNWLHNTVKMSNVTNGFWEAGTRVPPDFSAGYGYAITTESVVVLTMLKKRCLAKGLSESVCSFTV